MSECVVVGCDRVGVEMVSKQAGSEVWQYLVCDDHKAEVDNGAAIHDNADGHTIVLGVPDSAPAQPPAPPASDISLPVDDGVLIAQGDLQPELDAPGGNR